MPGSRIIRRAGRRLATALANQVKKNNLFEQPSERPTQAPVFANATPAETPAGGSDSAGSEAQKASMHEVEGCSVGGLTEVSALLSPVGKVRVINHWATWCDPCVEELPVLAALHQRLGAQADFHGVSWDLFEGGSPRAVAAQVADFARSHGIAYPSLLVDVDPERFFEALDLEFRKIPQTWVIGPDGEVLHRIDGILDEAGAEDLATRITAIVAAPVDAAAASPAG